MNAPLSLKEQIQNYEREIELRKLREDAPKFFFPFVQYTFPAYQDTRVHRSIAEILDCFAKGIIPKLIISMGPQHGKSELSTRRLPAYILGRNPDIQLTVASYSTTHARKFGIQVQRIISDRTYHDIFPNTTLQGSRYQIESESNYIKTQEEFEVVGRKGTFRAVGRGGALTGNTVDCMIIDDLYKDYAEGNSPIIREATQDWYISVVRTRLHNNSQELIVFTRWNENDIIGFIEKTENVILLTKREQLENPEKGAWYKMNFPSIATAECFVNEFDGRKVGEVVWPSRHSKEKLEADRALDEEKFASLHQGDPRPKTGLLYTQFNTYTRKPDLRSRKNYTDTADQGTDYLCSICYDVCVDDNIYITDIYFTQQPQEVTEGETTEMLNRQGIVHAVIESNNGGRAFARNVDRLSGYKHFIEWFHQSQNKESRILTNAAEIQRRVFFPLNWEGRWPEFASHIKGYRRNFKSNKYNDGADALTGVLEHSGVSVGENALYQW